jgi:hypothetical protein
MRGAPALALALAAVRPLLAADGAAAAVAASTAPVIGLQLDTKGNTDAADRLSACVRQKLEQLPDLKVSWSTGSYRASLQAFDSGRIMAVGFVATKPAGGSDGAVQLLDQSLFVQYKSRLDALCQTIAERIQKVATRPAPRPEDKTTTDNPRFNLGVW